MTRNADGSTTMNMGAKGTITQRMDMQTQTMTLESSNVTMAGFADMLTNHAADGRRRRPPGGGHDRPQGQLPGGRGDFPRRSMAVARAQGFNPPMPPPGGGRRREPRHRPRRHPIRVEARRVFASVKKLGLKLEPRKAPVEQLVIDHVEKTPTEN